MRGVTVYFVSLGGKEGGRLVWLHHVIEDNFDQTRPAEAINQFLVHHS